MSQVDETLDSIMLEQRRLFYINCRNLATGIEKQIHEMYQYIKKDRELNANNVPDSTIADMYFSGRVMGFSAEFFNDVISIYDAKKQTSKDGI